jgi:rubrerythrin
MSKSLKGTQTEKNILSAFAGESQARNRYSFFAKQARKEGFVQISEIFAETSEQEMAHAKTLFKLLEGGEVEITAPFRPAASERPWKICGRPPQAKTTSGDTCIRISSRPPKRRDFPRSPRS